MAAEQLCARCKKRAVCARACAALEKELDRITVYQRERLVSMRMLETLAENLAPPFPDPPDPDPPPDGLSRASLLRRLTRRQAQMMELVFWEGLNLAQAARRLGISRSAAHRRYRAGLQRVREAITQEENEA